MTKQEIDEIMDFARKDYEEILTEDPDTMFKDPIDGSIVVGTAIFDVLESKRQEWYKRHGVDTTTDEAYDRAMSIL